MADFNVAYLITMGNEGPYDNDPADIGGETYWGISRNYHPSWQGWRIIDIQKTKPNFPANLKDTIVLDGMVRTFYKDTFWDIFLGDKITNQDLANELFDTGVNMGISRAVTFLQQGLNVLNRNQALYPDIVVDGKFGNNTLNAINKYLETDSVDNLYKIMNILQGVHYINYMNQSPTQERFCRGWLQRIQFIKK